MMRNIGDLPEDLLLDILSKVPEASLARFRLASKGWKALVKKEGRLAKKSPVIMLLDSRVYLARFDPRGSHGNVVEVKSQISIKHPLSKSSEEVNICNVFHCDGLLLCTTKDNSDLVVLNPCLGQTSWVKPRGSHKKISMYAFGKSSCNQYKILRINKFSLMDIGLVDYEIYDLSSNSWRVTAGETRDWFMLGYLYRCGMSLNGNTYWVADGKGGEFLLSFDFSTERFGRVSLPVDRVSYHVFGLSVTREEQQLCLLTSQINRKVLDLWRAVKIEGTGSTSWSKFLSVDLASLHHPLSLVKGMNFLADRENKVLVCPGQHGNSNSRFLHIVGEDKCIQVDGHDPGSKCLLLIRYVPTLVQIQ